MIWNNLNLSHYFRNFSYQKRSRNIWKHHIGMTPPRRDLGVRRLDGGMLLSKKTHHKTSQSYEEAVVCVMKWFPVLEKDSLLSWNIVFSQCWITLQCSRINSTFQKRDNSTTVKVNVNQTEFENLSVFEHQALWRPSLVHDRHVSSVSLHFSFACSSWEGRTDIDGINQQCCFMLAPVSTKETAKTPSVFLPSESAC